MRAQMRGPEGTVEAGRERARMGDRDPEGFHRLAGEVASGHVGDGARDHHGNLDAERVLADLVAGGARPRAFSRHHASLVQVFRDALARRAEAMAGTVADGDRAEAGDDHQEAGS